MKNTSRYVIDSKIGEGTFGVVFHAFDNELERPVVVKLLNKLLERPKPEEVARFRREAVAAAPLTHRNIVTIYDIGVSTDGRVQLFREEPADPFATTDGDGLPYIVMEYLPGGDLRALLEGGVAIEPERAIEVVAQVADGLDFAHRAPSPVIHRDVKPANILLGREGGDVKLADFGLAKLSASLRTALTASNQFVGTLAYIAPEQLSGSKEVGPAADLFSLAIVLYEVLTHRKPFNGATPYELITCIKEREPEPLIELRNTEYSAVEEIVMSCLQRDPGRRLKSCGEFAKLLREQVSARERKMVAQEFAQRERAASAGELARLRAKIDAAEKEQGEVVERGTQELAMLRKEYERHLGEVLAKLQRAYALLTGE